MIAKIHTKKLSRRVRKLIDKHVEQFAQEVANEMARPIFEELADKLTAASASRVAAFAAPPNIALPLVSYDYTLKVWRCVKCEIYTDERRRAVSTHTRHCLGKRSVKQAA